MLICSFLGNGLFDEPDVFLEHAASAVRSVLDRDDAFTFFISAHPREENILMRQTLRQLAADPALSSKTIRVVCVDIAAHADHPPSPAPGPLAGDLHACAFSSPSPPGHSPMQYVFDSVVYPCVPPKTSVRAQYGYLHRWMVKRADILFSYVYPALKSLKATLNTAIDCRVKSGKLRLLDLTDRRTALLADEQAKLLPEHLRGVYDRVQRGETLMTIARDTSQAASTVGARYFSAQRILQRCFEPHQSREI